MKLAQRRIRQLRTAERLVREGIIKVPPSGLELAQASIERAVAESLRQRDPCGACRSIREKERHRIDHRIDPLRAIDPGIHDLYIQNSRRIHCQGEHETSVCIWRP